MNTARAALVLLLLSAFAGCGRNDSGGPPAVIHGPPMWRVLRDESRGGESGFALRAQTAIRARLRLVSSTGMPEDGPWHTITTGQTTHVLWSVRTNAPTNAEDIALPEDSEAGRTEAKAAVLRFRLSGSPVWQRRYVLWARPDRGRLLATECVPPGSYEKLSWDRPVEVAALVMTDLASGEARLLPRQPRSKLILPKGMEPADRHEDVRVLLMIEPLSKK